MRRGGFTLLEMMLATVVGAVVILAAVGTLGLVQRTEQRLSEGYDDVVELARVQGTLRRAMQSFVAANPAGQTGVGAGADQDDDADADDDDDDDDPADDDAPLDDQDDDDEDERAGADGGAPSGPRPMLDIGPLDPETDEDVHVGDAEWRLEATFSGAPLGPVDPASGEVRGAFELIRREPGDWIIVWTSLEPAEEPVILAEGLEYAMLAALTRDNLWTDRLEARSMEDFPRAIRVAIMTRSGRTADWLLEPGVTLGTRR